MNIKGDGRHEGSCSQKAYILKQLYKTAKCSIIPFKLIPKVPYEVLISKLNSEKNLPELGRIAKNRGKTTKSKMAILLGFIEKSLIALQSSLNFR